LEIDLDKTCYLYHEFEVGDGVVKRASSSAIVAHNAMINASSLSPEISAMVNDGVSRMNRGEIREFEHQIEDRSGNNHRFIYRK